MNSARDTRKTNWSWLLKIPARFLVDLVADTTSKHKLTEIFLLVIFSLSVLLTGLNYIDYLMYPAIRVESLFYILSDLCFIFFFFFLYWLHRRGYSKAASLILLTSMVIVISTSLDIYTLSGLLIFYAIPILTASFVLQPASSFIFAIYSTVGYGLAWHYNAQIVPFSIVNVITFYALAATSYIVSWQLNRMISQLQMNENHLITMVNLFQMQDVTIDEIIQRTLEECIRMTQSQYGYLAFLNEDETILSIHTWSNLVMRDCKIQTPQINYLVSETGLWGEAIRQRRPVITNNYHESGVKKRGYPPGHIPIERHLGLPIFDRERIVAVIGVANKELPYINGDAHQLFIVMNEMWNIIQRRKMVTRLEQSNRELTEAYSAMLTSLVHALEMRHKDTEQHSHRTIELTVQLARACGFPEEQMDHLRRGVWLHDIGKIGVPDQILNKTGPLTEEEWKEMRRHPSQARDLLAPVAHLRPVVDIPYCHHEKWDGSGYPQGLRGEEIPLAARIFSIIDVWDAVTTARPYRPAWSKKRALDYICAQAGKHFDPHITEVFLTTINNLPVEEHQDPVFSEQKPVL